ncbi:MAG TPA: hypothetical protein VFZ65_00805 [Planctomycetota bacterium]|nr:hypothetical protein [Planctomycetota bacterium]
MTSRPLCSLAAAALALTVLRAQTPPSELDLTELARDLVVPVHTATADPVGGAYGIWAAGPTYKASFHDGFTFYPLLGRSAPTHLPLQWRTESVMVGAVQLPLDGVARWSGCHFERAGTAIVETYDVRADGVEQTFTLRQRPAAAGDLVITARVSTPLACTAAEPAVQELCFADRETAVIRYGRASACDAAGNTAAVTTSWDGSRIRLVLSGAFLAEAVYPVVVDPLIAAVTLASSLPTVYGPAAITARPETNGRMVIAWSREATASDYDAYALLVSRDFTSGTWLYTDLQAGWSSFDVDATYVGSGAKWVVTQRRHFGSNSDLVRIYLHDVASTVVNSGVTLYPSAPSGFQDLEPVVAGSRYGGMALVAATRRHTASGVRTIVGMRVDALAQSLGTDVNFTAGFLEPLSAPRVTPMTLGTGGWVVAAWGTSGIRVAKVPNTGGASVATQLLVPAGTVIPSASTRAIAGTDGRYLLAYCQRVAYVTSGSISFADELLALRFDWAASASTPTALGTSIVATQSGPGPVFSFEVGGMEHDLLTRSHWGLGFTRPAQTGRIVRLGFSGGLVEIRFVVGQCDVAFALAGGHGSFPVVDTVDTTSGVTILGSELEYSNDAISVEYGASCAAAGVVASSDPPFAGSEFFHVRVAHVLPGVPCVYALSDTMGSFDLTPLGFTGCTLNIGLPVLGTLLATADLGGNAQVVYSLPDTPALIGDVFSQWFYFDPAAAPVPFRAHSGLLHQIR